MVDIDWPLIYKRNNKGPKVDPLRIPHAYISMLNEIPCRKTYCLRFLKIELSQLIHGYCNIQVSYRILWFTVSNAFWRQWRFHNHQSHYLFKQIRGHSKTTSPQKCQVLDHLPSMPPLVTFFIIHPPHVTRQIVTNCFLDQR